MPLPENNILFYWTAPNGAVFMRRMFLKKKITLDTYRRFTGLLYA